MYFNKRHDRHQDALRPEPRALQRDDDRKVELNIPKPPPRSLLESSLTMTGDLWSEGDVEIDGHFCGNINCQQLIVGKNGAITGVIVAQEAVIRGKITGIIRAMRVLLQDSARVESDIFYQSLSVDEGASFEGVARPRPDPLAEETALSPMAELRQSVAQVEAPGANGAAAKTQPTLTGAVVANPDPPRQLARASGANR
jgi:cytoskeletal protein CcmA (bactofilin family)